MYLDCSQMAESQDDQMQSVVTCDTCDETAEHLCITCQDRLCPRCKVVHSRSKASFDHGVVLLSSSSISQAHEERFSSQQVCSKHAGYRISICCGDCEIPICEKCLLPDHNGHRVISIPDLIKQKKPKLEAKYLAISSQLPQYEEKLAEIKERSYMVAKNGDHLEEKKEKHFRTIKSQIENHKSRLIKDVRKNKTVVMDNLKSHEEKFEEYIKEMKTFMSEFKTNAKNHFILFGNCDVGATMPNGIPRTQFPELLQYKTELHDAVPLNSLCGRLFEGNILQRENNTKTLQDISVGNNDIKSLAYRYQDDTFWLYTDRNIFQIDRKGRILHTIVAQIQTFSNKPVVVSRSGTVIHRQKQFTLNEKEYCGFDKEFFTTSYSAPLCLWARKEGGVIVGFLDKDESDGGFFWLTEDAVIEKEIRNDSAWNDVYKKYFVLRTRAYVAENVNGDICFSNRSVEVYDSNLQHRFSYPDATDVESFLPQDICTDDFGHILIADQRSRLIHILNKNGVLLKMVKLPGLSTSYPISLTIDVNRCLCIGCSDGKIRFIDYLTILDNL